MSSTAAINFDRLSKVFGRRRRVEAVRGLDLEIQPGQVYGFLGPNGAGKSTTIRMMMDLIRPSRGSVYLFGHDVRKEHEVLEKRVGALVEGAMFYDFLTGRRNLEILARTNGRYDSDHIQRLLERVGMADRADRRVKGYSTGMKQRLGLAAALIGDPDLVLLDEPTNGLDPAGMHEIRQFIRQLVDRQGKTVFLSSHLLGEVEQICDRVAIIDQGQVVREGAVSELLAGEATLIIEATPLDLAETVLFERWSVSRNSHRLVVKADRRDAPAIIRLLVDNEIQLFQVQIQRRTLEELFLSVTGGNGKRTEQDPANG